jgi:nitrogen fixation/metabolism regulation signal transduction histidine kinase
MQAEDFIKKQPDDVPESFGNIIDLVHEADEDQLNQALTNLIINSDQAMHEGGTIQIDTENKHIVKSNTFNSSYPSSSA